jgi:hypothetical protein
MTDRSHMRHQAQRLRGSRSFRTRVPGQFVIWVTVGKLQSPPSLERLGTLLGGAAKYPVYEAFGRSPGVVGMLGEGIGVPPDWTDKGAAARRD